VIGRLTAYPTGRLGLQIPFFRAPAACWWARAVVESTDTSQTICPAASAIACNTVRIAAQVPSRGRTPLPAEPDWDTISAWSLNADRQHWGWA
jgi:hypothetical protein